jgi:hypothetical protein
MILKDENSEKVLQYMEKINLPAGVLQMNWKPFLEEWAERNVML